MYTYVSWSFCNTALQKPQTKSNQKFLLFSRIEEGAILCLKRYWTVECSSLEMNTWRLDYLLTSKAVTPAELLWAYIVAKNNSNTHVVFLSFMNCAEVSCCFITILNSHTSIQLKSSFGLGKAYFVKSGNVLVPHIGLPISIKYFRP
jgi:hypothetical protein